MVVAGLLSQLIAVVLLCFVRVDAMAQTALPSAPSEQQLLKPEALDQLLAPVALYPDTLLSKILVASTYPLEIVQADRWVKANTSLKGDALTAAVAKQNWDEGVKSLAAVPSVLGLMADKLDWMTSLGDAVLAQEPDVMDAIQRLRSRAHANNKLSSTAEQTVTVRQEQNKQIIAIEPTVPDTIHVPHYDSGVVYAGWPYADYPPYSFAAPGYVSVGLLTTGVAFGTRYALGRWTSGGNRWGGGFNWGNNNIARNRPIEINKVGETWQHRPEHRHGIRYNNVGVQQRFGQNTGPGKETRLDYRGRSGQRVLKPDADRPTAADRGVADRAAAGDRGRVTGVGAGDRVGVGNPGSERARGQGERTASRGSGAAAKASARDRALPASKNVGVRGSGRDNAFNNVQPKRMANLQSQRGHASLAGGSPHAAAGFSRGAGGLGGGGLRGGGGRRSDVALKQNVMLLGRLENGLGFYRFTYIGADQAYVGVMAQEVEIVAPSSVVRGRDGYLEVLYEKLGLRFQTYERWVASGARVPANIRISR